MKSAKYIFILGLIVNLMSCGPSEEKKVCASGVRKEFTDDAVYATVEEGCVIKLSTPHEYKANGSVNLKITSKGDNVDYKVQLTKGFLTTKGGEFIIHSIQKSLKVRLISGQGNVTVGDKAVTLEPNKVLEIGS
jgi:hypothetical protein